MECAFAADINSANRRIILAADNARRMHVEDGKLNALRRMPRRFLVALIVTALIAAVLFAWPTRAYLCWTFRATSYEPLGSIALRIPPQLKRAYLDDLRTFSRRHRMLFAVDYYPPGSAGIQHARYVTESFNCDLGFTSDNPFDEKIVYLHAARTPRKNNDKARIVFAAIKRELARKYETVPEAEP